MAFNLNKGEDQKSKFDLSKSSSIVSDEIKGKKSFPLLWVFLSILVLGSGIWYLVGGKKQENISMLPKSAGDSNVATSPTRPVDKSKNASTADTASLSTAENGISNNKKNDTAAASSVSAVKSKSSNRSTESTAQYISPAKFSLGSSVLNLNETAAGKIVATLLRNADTKVTITGYASNDGDLLRNQLLSEKRATSFKTYLISKGIAADRISASGKGVDNPVATNDSEEGRIKNRRVEVSIQ